MTFPLAIKHLHGFVYMLYCHFMDMKQVFCNLCNIIHGLDICVLTVAKSAVVEVPLWKHRSIEARQRWASMLVLLKKEVFAGASCKSSVFTM